MNKQTKFLISIAICYCLVIKPDAIGAQTLDEELKKCSEITVSLIRLQCYDRLSKEPEVRSAQSSNQTKRRNIFQRRSRDNAVKQEEQKTTTEETSTDSPVANESDNVNESSDDFGKVTREDSNEINSRIVGKFNGWTGETEFRLDNNQIWKQSGNGFLKVSMNNPKVKIEAGMFGGYILSVEGYNSRVKVKRVK